MGRKGPSNGVSAAASLGVSWGSCTQMSAGWWPISHWAGDGREGLSI